VVTASDEPNTFTPCKSTDACRAAEVPCSAVATVSHCLNADGYCLSFGQDCIEHLPWLVKPCDVHRLNCVSFSLALPPDTRHSLPILHVDQPHPFTIEPYPTRSSYAPYNDGYRAPFPLSNPSFTPLKKRTTCTCKVGCGNDISAIHQHSGMAIGQTVV
jgi:hypothetical protein